MIVIEPHILVAVTTIVAANKCVRDTMLKRDYRDDTTFKWSCVFGNIIHEVFQLILYRNNFLPEAFNKIIAEVSKKYLIQIHACGKSLTTVQDEIKKGIKNMSKWLSAMINPKAKESGHL